MIHFLPTASTEESSFSRDQHGHLALEPQNLKKVIEIPLIRNNPEPKDGEL